MTRREHFLAECLSLMGTPYLWGGKTMHGLDCSGLVTYALQKVGGADWRNTHSSARLWAELPPLELPEPGALAFYGPKGTPSHVVVCLFGGGIIGANGGSSRTTSVELARASGACVKRKHSPGYRPDLLGYRRLPWLDQ